MEFSPTLQTLAGVVNDIGSHLISTISVFRHLPDILIKRKMQRDPIHTIVGKWAACVGLSGAVQRQEVRPGLFWVSHHLGEWKTSSGARLGKEQGRQWGLGSGE